MHIIQGLNGPEAALGIDTVQTQLSFLLGRVLTIADASFADKEQRKAAKDLIRSEFNSKANLLAELACGDNRRCGQSESADVARNSTVPIA